MNSAWLITKKDLWLLAKDRRAAVLLVALPMVFISIVGMSTGQLLTRGEGVQARKLVVADESQSAYSRELIESFRTRSGVDIVPLGSSVEARQRLDLGRADGAILIGPNFESKVDELRITDILDVKRGRLAGGLDQLDLVVETRPGIVDVELFRAGLFEAIFKMVGPIVGRRNPLTRRFFRDEGEVPADSGAEDADATEAARPAGQALTTDAASSDSEHLGVPKKKGREGIYLILVPGFTVMFVFFLVNIMARSFITERETGTLRRLQLAPITRMSVLIGKTLPFYLISIVQCLVLFGSGRLLFSMSWGPQPVYLVPMILCTSLAATTLGLLLATVVKTEQQVSAYGTSLVILLAAISGCFMPRDWLPETMQRISLATPHAWALQGFDAVLTRRAVDAMVIGQCCGMLVLFSTVFLLVGWWKFRQI